jgi:amphi-Trp domain-containing protein
MPLFTDSGGDKIQQMDDQRRLKMAIQKKKRERDIEKNYPAKQFVLKLRRLADCIEQGQKFQIQVAGERIYIPAAATINIEHERSDSFEELEFQLTWSLEPAADKKRR